MADPLSSPLPFGDDAEPSANGERRASGARERRRRSGGPERRRRSISRASSVDVSTPRDFGSVDLTPLDTPITPRSRGTPFFGDQRPSPVRRRARRSSSPGVGLFQGHSSDADHNSDIQQLLWGTNICVGDVRRTFERFLKGFRTDPTDLNAKYMKYLEEIILEEKDTMNIDAKDIWDSERELYSQLVRFPLEVLAIFDTTVKDLEEAIRRELNPAFENYIQVRVFNLRESVNLRELNPSDIEKLVSVKGMIIRCSALIPEIRDVFFKCMACGHYPPPAIVERGLVDEPMKCPRQECEKANSMALIHNRCRFADKQLVRLQETPDAIPEGETPHTVSLCMFDKLVDAAKPGDRVEVTGVFRAMPVRVGPAQRVVKSLYRTYIDCVHMKKHDSTRMQAEDPAVQNRENEFFSPFPEANISAADEEAKTQKLKQLSRLPDIYERLTRSLAPSIWELDDVKKGLLCQLFGGSLKKTSGGAQIRGDVNVLLVGDPGTSKSQLLQYVHKLSPRGIYTSGRGSSAVGLTAFVAKDPESKEMVLESGALVLSDRGICCIDEFDKMSESARSMLHEVMEQQTVSVAKAGIIATLNARTSVLACANPSGSRYNPRHSVIDNIHLPPTLLSRFDLIYLVLDKADEQTDRRLARHLVALHFEDPEIQTHECLDLPTLTSYISYARQHCQPTLSDAAAEILIQGYVEMRRLGNSPGSSKKVITATPRQLESMIRLSEALARIEFGEEVLGRHAEEAIRLMKVALQQSATDYKTGTIDIDQITTGVSASERSRRSNLQTAAQRLITEKIHTGQSVKFTQLLDEMRKDSTAEITLQDLRTALTQLATENFISIHGDTFRRS